MKKANPNQFQKELQAAGFSAVKASIIHCSLLPSGNYTKDEEQALLTGILITLQKVIKQTFKNS